LILVLGWLLIARTVLAQARVDEARERYRKATAAYNLGHYAEAAREYEATYELTLDPAVLFNTAQAYRLAGEAQKAILAYKGYLRAATQGPQREIAQQKLQELTRVRDGGGASASTAEAPHAAPPPLPAPAPAPAALKSTPAPAAALTAPVALAAPRPAAPAEALVASPSSPPSGAERPFYRRWPFWVATGVVVVGAIALGIVLASSSKGPPSQNTTFGSMTF
jgi:tetratricopeptide (TPR) repeat protein